MLQSSKWSLFTTHPLSPRIKVALYRVAIASPSAVSVPGYPRNPRDYPENDSSSSQAHHVLASQVVGS